jgi:hypothetical protein
MPIHPAAPLHPALGYRVQLTVKSPQFYVPPAPGGGGGGWQPPIIIPGSPVPPAPPGLFLGPVSNPWSRRHEGASTALAQVASVTDDDAAGLGVPGAWINPIGVTPDGPPSGWPPASAGASTGGPLVGPRGAWINPLGESPTMPPEELTGGTEAAAPRGAWVGPAGAWINPTGTLPHVPIPTIAALGGGAVPSGAWIDAPPWALLGALFADFAGPGAVGKLAGTPDTISRLLRIWEELLRILGRARLAIEVVTFIERRRILAQDLVASLKKRLTRARGPAPFLVPLPTPSAPSDPASPPLVGPVATTIDLKIIALSDDQFRSTLERALEFVLGGPGAREETGPLATPEEMEALQNHLRAVGLCTEDLHAFLLSIYHLTDGRRVLNLAGPRLERRRLSTWEVFVHAWTLLTRLVSAFTGQHPVHVGEDHGGMPGTGQFPVPRPE